MKPTAKKTYRIIKLLLENEGLSQRELENLAPASHSWVSKVLTWLERLKYVEWINGGYQPLNPAGLLTLFSLYRNMDDARRSSHFLSLSPSRVIDMLPKGAILCIDSALAIYSDYYRSSRVTVYLEPGELSRQELVQYAGQLTELSVYTVDLPVDQDLVAWRGFQATDKIRTLIDLACDLKLYAGKDLLREIWGVEIE